MRAKQQRLDAIKEIVSRHKIKNQEELVPFLKEMGFDVTQATLSRDLKDLRIAKVHDVGGSCYRIPSLDANPALVTGKYTVDGIRSLAFSGNIVVIKTHPGFASVIASIIDLNVDNIVLGSIAGDDTIMLVIHEAYNKVQVLAALEKEIQGISRKLVK